MFLRTGLINKQIVIFYVFLIEFIDCINYKENNQMGKYGKLPPPYGLIFAGVALGIAFPPLLLLVVGYLILMYFVNKD